MWHSYYWFIGESKWFFIEWSQYGIIQIASFLLHYSDVWICLGLCSKIHIEVYEIPFLVRNSMSSSWRSYKACILHLTDRRMIWNHYHRDKDRIRKKLMINAQRWYISWSLHILCWNCQVASISASMWNQTRRFILSTYTARPDWWQSPIPPSIFWSISRRASNFAIISGERFRVWLVIVNGGWRGIGCSSSIINRIIVGSSSRKQRQSNGNNEQVTVAARLRSLSKAVTRTLKHSRKPCYGPGNGYTDLSITFRQIWL